MKNRNRFKTCVFIVLAVSIQTFLQSSKNWSLSSPDGKVTCTVVNNSQKPGYFVLYEKDTVIRHSPLGLNRADQSFSEGLEWVSTGKPVTIDEVYTKKTGKKLVCRNNANEFTLTFQNKDKANIQLIVRAYNDGVAFRYNFPDKENKKYTILNEETGFAIATYASAWMSLYDMSRNKPCYEEFFENGIPVGTPSNSWAGWSFPATFNSGKYWILLTEAALNGTYCATHLDRKSEKGVYKIRFAEKEEVNSPTGHQPVSTLPWATPWRVIIVGTSPAALIETNIISNLNPPSILKDDSWIKPGRSAWSWWSQEDSPNKFDIQMKYVDFASEMGWEYILIDEGWPNMIGGDIKDVVKHGLDKGVGIVLWYRSGADQQKDTLTVKNVMSIPEARKAEFKKLKEWGVKGIKVDFFDCDKQPVIQLYEDILKDAAEYQITVNCHGSTLPRGWERTYPHLVSMESVRGAETFYRQYLCNPAPLNNTILPFTRNVVGSMDYTPLTFDLSSKGWGDAPMRITSYGHELALSVVFESGVTHFADNAKTYQGFPGFVKEYLKTVPTTWDETRFIAGRPGEEVVIARRKGTVWYVAGINGQSKEKELALDLSVLGKDGSMNVITDGVAGTDTFTSLKVPIINKFAKIKILPRGGFVGVVR